MTLIYRRRLLTPPASGSSLWLARGLAGEITRAEFFGVVTTTAGLVKAWTGTAWTARPVKVWLGAAWVQKPLKRWDGAAWLAT